MQPESQFQKTGSFHHVILPMSSSWNIQAQHLDPSVNGQSTNPRLTYPARNKALLNPYFREGRLGGVRLTGHEGEGAKEHHCFVQLEIRL